MKTKIATLGMFFILSACSSSLGIKQQSFDSNIFKTHGFYYSSKTFETFFFFHNGTILGPWMPFEPFNTHSDDYKKAEIVNYWKQHIDVFGGIYKGGEVYWGLFRVNGNNLSILYRGGETAVIEIPGEVINDTTLVILRTRTAPYTHIENTTKDTLNFQYLDIVPDSIDKEIR